MAGGGGMPPNWWLNTDGVAVTSNTQFKELVSGSDAAFKDKHVFIDFYMQGCYWCYVFQEEWNQLLKDLKAKYGTDKVEFIKVDGNKVYEVSRKYSVESFPTFVYVQPNSRGLKAQHFMGERTYHSMKEWMESFLKDIPELIPEGGSDHQIGINDVDSIDIRVDDGLGNQIGSAHQELGGHGMGIPQHTHDSQGDQTTLQYLHELLSNFDHIAQSVENVQMNQKKIAQSLSNNNKQTEQNNQNINKFSGQFDDINRIVSEIKAQQNKDMDLGGKGQHGNGGINHNSIIYAMGGLILGAISSVVMIGYLSKSGAFNKKRANNSQMRGSVYNDSLLQNQKLNDFESAELHSMDDEKIN